MKKLLIALSLSALLLSGCGMFRSHHAWKEAQQENPLQIPPGLDRPATTDALTIPPPVQQAPAQTQAPAVTQAGSNHMQLPGDVAKAYQRVGLALQRGDLGTVTAHDDQAHTYTLRIASKPAVGEADQGFLQKHFSNVQRRDASGTDANAAPEETSGVTVRLAVTADVDGSRITASGDPAQAVHVISVLRGRLGG